MGSSVHMLLTAFFVTTLSSCVSNLHSEISDSDSNFLERTPSTLGTLAEELESELDNLADSYNPDVIMEDICKDDIYSNYLKKQYLSEHPAKRYRSRKSRQRQVIRREVDSLFFARSRLLGDMPPYFGALPVVSNSMVEYWIRYFKKNGRQTFLKWLIRAESTRKTVEPLLQQEGLPKELFFLGMIESGYSNTARSHARATGSWQFMYGTAKLYGLEINHWVDERRDPVKSTVAAARFLKDLYARFGDWYLAMAAYNAGPGKISKAIRKSKSRDFWKIADTRYIRAETKHYVPKMLAALTIASNPSAHGFNFSPDPNHELPNTYVTLERPVRLQELAKHLSIGEKQIREWNPELINSITPPNKRKGSLTYQLRLAPTLIEPFHEIQNRLAYLEIRDVKMYRIQRGDTLSTIARRHGVRTRQIRAVNHNLHPRRLRIGKTIAIPIPSVMVVKKKKRDAA